MSSEYKIPTPTNVFKIIASSETSPWENLPERYKTLPVDRWKRIPKDVMWNRYPKTHGYYQIVEKMDEKEAIVLVSDGRERKHWIGLSIELTGGSSEISEANILLLGTMAEISLQMYLEGNRSPNTYVPYR